MLSVHRVESPRHPALRTSVLMYGCSSDPSWHTPAYEYVTYPTMNTALLWHGKGRLNRDRDFACVDDAQLRIIRPGAQLTACPTAQGSLVVILQPGAARRLLGISAKDLPANEVNITDIIGHEATVLAERMAMCALMTERIDVLETWMLQRLSQTRLSTSPCLRICALTQPVAHTSATDMAMDSGMSLRQMRKHFSADLGLSPKVYLRLIRFRTLLQHGLKHTDRDWTRLSHAFGFYDQSHLIKEFHEFVGMSPTRFFGLVQRSETMLDGLAIPKTIIKGADFYN